MVLICIVGTKGLNEKKWYFKINSERDIIHNFAHETAPDTKIRETIAKRFCSIK